VDLPKQMREFKESTSNFWEQLAQYSKPPSQADYEAMVERNYLEMKAHFKQNRGAKSEPCKCDGERNFCVIRTNQVEDEHHRWKEGIVLNEIDWETSASAYGRAHRRFKTREESGGVSHQACGHFVYYDAPPPQPPPPPPQHAYHQPPQEYYHHHHGHQDYPNQMMTMGMPQQFHGFNRHPPPPPQQQHQFHAYNHPPPPEAMPPAPLDLTLNGPPLQYLTEEERQQRRDELMKEYLRHIVKENFQDEKQNRHNPGRERGQPRGGPRLVPRIPAYGSGSQNSEPISMGFNLPSNFPPCVEHRRASTRFMSRGGLLEVVPPEAPQEYPSSSNPGFGVEVGEATSTVGGTEWESGHGEEQVVVGSSVSEPDSSTSTTDVRARAPYLARLLGKMFTASLLRIDAKMCVFYFSSLLILQKHLA